MRNRLYTTYNSTTYYTTESFMTTASGYCHFNDGGTGKNRYFKISLFGHDLMILQNPDSRILGHGAVVWDAAVVFAKYMEHNLSQKEFSTTKLKSQTVIELGSGCGLAGIAFMLRGASVTLTDLPGVVDALECKHDLYTDSSIFICWRRITFDVPSTAPAGFSS